MIFFSKRSTATAPSSKAEGCVSILGLLLATGMIGGLSALIYGLVRGNASGTIGGGVVLGVSVFLSVILALVFIYCIKNNNVDEQQSSSHHHHHHHQRQPPPQGQQQLPHRQISRAQISLHESPVVSGVHKYDNPQRYASSGYDVNQFSPPIQNVGLGDSIHSGYGGKLFESPSKISSFHFNQNNGSMLNQSQSANIKRENDSRY